jgi:hypothetical protein
MEESQAEEASESIVTEAKERYKKGREFYSKFRSNAIEDTRFYLGDSENGWQWPQNITLQRGTIEQRPCLTINITAQHVNQIVNTTKESKPTGKVIPVDDGADKKTAEIIEGVIRNIQSVSNADDVHGTAMELSVAGGDGYWRIITDYESPDSFDQVIKIVPIMDSGSVTCDPYTKEIDKSDKDWAFVEEIISKEECERRWPNIDVSSWSEDKESGWVTKDGIRVCDYYCAYYTDDILYQLPDGSSELKSKMPADVVKQLDGLVKNKILKSRPTKTRSIKIHKLVGGSDEPLESVDWVGTVIPVIELVGKEVSVNGELIRKGLVRDIKDSARMVNYSYSAAIESVALQNKVPYIAPFEAIEGHEDIWNKANIENRSYLPYNHIDDQGKEIPHPERQQPAIMPAAQIQMLQLSVDQMRAASGQQNANFGIKSDAQSGIGIQRLKVQGEVATYHFQDQFNRALKYEIKVLLELICSGKILDTRRVMRIIGIDGAQTHAMMDVNHPAAHDEIQQGDITAIFNPTIGTYDVSIDTGPSFSTKRQEGAQMMSDILSKNPPLMQTIGDLAFKAMDFPYADKIADRMYKMLPPQLQDGQKDQLPPQVQQSMQMASQHIQQQDQMIQQLQQEVQQKQSSDQLMQAKAQKDVLDAHNASLKLQIDQYNAETARMQAQQQAQPEDQTIKLAELHLKEKAQSIDAAKSRLVADTQVLIAQMNIEAANPGLQDDDRSALMEALANFQQSLDTLTI